jgi:hypothetical protein
MASQVITLTVKTKNAEKVEKDIDKIAKAAKDFEKNLKSAADRSAIFSNVLGSGMRLAEKAVKELFQAAVKLVEIMTKPLQTTFKSISDDISKNYLEVVGKAILENGRFQNAIAMVDEALARNKPNRDDMKDWVDGLVKAFIDFSAEASSWCDTLIGAAIKVIDYGIQPLIWVLQEAANGFLIIPKILGVGLQIGQQIARATSGVWVPVLDAILKAWDYITEISSKCAAVVFKLFDKMVKAAKEYMGPLFEVFDKIKGIWDDIFSAPDTATGKAVDDFFAKLIDMSDIKNPFDVWEEGADGLTVALNATKKATEKVAAEMQNIAADKGTRKHAAPLDQKELKDIARRNKAVYDMSEDLLSDTVKAERAAARKSLQIQADKLQKMGNEFVEYHDKQAEFAEKAGKAMDERFTRIGEKVAEIGTMIVDEFQTAISSIVDGTKTVKEAFGDMAINVVQTVLKMALSIVINAAISAAAQAGSAVASIPYIGPILAIVAAATVFSLIAAYRNKAAKGMAMGGLVTGGIPNQDSVPTNLMPGERVLNKRETQDYEHLKSRESRQGGRPMVINVALSQTTGSRSAQENYISKSVLPAIRRFRKLGFT